MFVGGKIKPFRAQKQGIVRLGASKKNVRILSQHSPLIADETQEIRRTGYLVNPFPREDCPCP